MRHGTKGIKFDFDDLVYFKNFLCLFFSKDITEVIGLDLIMHYVDVVDLAMRISPWRSLSTLKYLTPYHTRLNMVATRSS